MSDTPNTPAPEPDRAAPILALLAELNARCMWQRSIASGPDQRIVVDCYTVNGFPLILMRFTNKELRCTDGWNVFFASRGNRIDDTLDQVRRYANGASSTESALRNSLKRIVAAFKDMDIDYGEARAALAEAATIIGGE